MASIFGDDGAEDILNDNLQEDHELPSDDEEKLNGADGNGENIFGDENADADGAENPEKVETKKRTVRNPRPRLTLETLRGPRGIQTIEEYFKDIKFKGKGHEKNDLDEVLRRMQHWGHRMYPSYKFEDVLTNIERLGKKKPLSVHMSRYRLGLLEHLNIGLDAEVHDDDDEGANGAPADEPFDEFDALLGEQIAISKLIPRTPVQNAPNRYAGGLTNTTVTSSSFSTPSFTAKNAVMSTPYTDVYEFNDSDLAQPLPPSQPPTPAANHLSTEQMERMAQNRRIAQERLQAKKLQRLQEQQSNSIDVVEAQV